MVFSSLATDLSANSARVSACITETDSEVSPTLDVETCVNYPGVSLKHQMGHCETVPPSACQ